MEQVDIVRLEAIELRSKEIYKEIFGLEVPEIYFDCVPDQKMLEILAYGFPTGISHWIAGRNYEKLRTIHDHQISNLPMEVVIFSDPHRAYLMQSNTFAVHVLVMVHVQAHCLVFQNNRYFRNTRRDLTNVIQAANHRFNHYEEIYGIDEMEIILDAGKALQYHSSPFDVETEAEKKKRVYENRKKVLRSAYQSEFHDIGTDDNTLQIKKPDIDKFNHQLWREIIHTIPIEPTADILRFIIDESRYLEDWQKDILEVLRMEGQYYFPMMNCKYLHEGFATFAHQKVIHQLVKEGYLTAMEFGQYAYANSLVKSQQKMAMNPYLIGCELFTDIEDRWNKGRYGTEWDACTDYTMKQDWDTKAGFGIEKVVEVITTYTDWMLIQSYLTHDLIDKLDLYIYVEQENLSEIEYIRTRHTIGQIKTLIVECFAVSGIPKIEVVDGNYKGLGGLLLQHRYSGILLDPLYTEKTLEHICQLWGGPVYLNTEIGAKKVQVKVGMRK